jgi:hypothetical protein
METELEFKGKKIEREIAEKAFGLMVRQGAMFSMDTPIRQSLENLVEYFHENRLRRDRNRVIELVEEALSKNDHIFARETHGDQTIYVTTKRGRPGEGEATPSLPPRQRHSPPKGATSKPRRKAVRRPPMAPFWVRAAIRQMQPVRPTPPPRPATATTIPTVEEVAVTAIPREELPVAELVLDDGTTIDFSQDVTKLFALHGNLIEEKLQEALAQDFRILSFGDQWFIEGQLEHFSKGRLNEIRRYVLEEETPLTDETILGDLFFKNPRDQDYNLWAFSLNARLLREKKDFEYVGVPGSNLWSVKGLPSIGSDQIKASEVGQDYTFLLEEEAEKEAPVQLEHFLTFYEYRYGVLPYDARFQSFFPPSFLEDQRSAQLRFEIPQHYEAYTVELRYPSGNRGGWLWGLEDFFHSSLVPGAFIVISSTDEPDIFILQYLATDAQERSLLVFEERKNRYIFDDILFYCETEESLILSEERFPKLHRSRVLAPSKRKRPADVIAHAFSLVGEEQDGQYMAFLEDLFPVINIERPFSLSYAKKLLHEIDVFSPGEEEGIYLYTPGE